MIFQEISNNYKIIKCINIRVIGKLLEMAIINLVTKNHRIDLIFIIPFKSLNYTIRPCCSDFDVILTPLK